MEIVVEGLGDEDDDRSLDEKLREFLHMAAAAMASGRIWDLTRSIICFNGQDLQNYHSFFLILFTNLFFN